MERLYKRIFNEEEIIYKDDSLGYFRQLCYTFVAVFSVLAGLPLATMGAITFIKHELILGALLNVVFYGSSIVIILHRQLSKKVKYIAVIITVNAIGYYLTIMAGSNSAASVMLIFAFVIAGFLLGKDQAKFFIGMNIAISLGILILYAQKVLDHLGIANYGPGIYLYMLTMLLAGSTMLAIIYETISGLDRQIGLVTQSESKVRSIMNTLTTGVMVLDEHGRIKMANEIATHHYQNKERSIIGRHINEVMDIFEILTEKPVPDLFLRLVDQKDKDHRVLFKDHHRNRYLTCRLTPIESSIDGSIEYVLVVSDITEMREEEINLVHSQRIEAIGTIAGGVAHDFNNMLGAILGFAQLIGEFVKETDGPVYKFNQKIIESALKAARLTKQLLLYARKEDLVMTSMPIVTSIRNAVVLMERTFEKKIDISLNIIDEDIIVHGDSTLLENAFLNLGLNAKDAMKLGGRLIITLKKVQIKDVRFKNLPNHLLTVPDDTLMCYIGFKDQGMGMSKEVLDHVFEPFYTTKEVGKGTGLGLSASYGTVIAHHGAIDIKSILGVGTVVEMLLPLSSETINHDSISAIESFLPIHEADGLILVVDDEDVVRTMLSEMLIMFGYQVLGAKDGIEALEIFKSHGHNLHCVFLDMIMPKLGGKETLLEMKKIAPQVPVHIMSGFLNDDHQTDLYACGAATLINKPFTIDQVKNILNKSG